MKGTMVAGSVRKGGGLLVGLLRCGHCARKLQVLHHARRDTRYICQGQKNYAPDKKCIVFSNMRVDVPVSRSARGGSFCKLWSCSSSRATAASRSFHRRSSSPATSRLSGSTASYCRRACVTS